MGGFGSGNDWHWWRPAKKNVVENCRSIDAGRWSREGILRAGVRQIGGWNWRHPETEETTASIAYEVDTLNRAFPIVRLSYRVSGDPIEYPVPLHTTPIPKGGWRWWFNCPLVINGRACRRRVRLLYLPPGSRYFGCRKCHNLTYTSSQEPHRFDGLYRFMAKQEGLDLATVKELMKR